MFQTILLFQKLTFHLILLQSKLYKHLLWLFKVVILNFNYFFQIIIYPSQNHFQEFKIFFSNLTKDLKFRFKIIVPFLNTELDGLILFFLYNINVSLPALLVPIQVSSIYHHFTIFIFPSVTVSLLSLFHFLFK